MDAAGAAAARYHDTGLVVLRNAVPPSLLAELRAAAGHAADLARRAAGPQCQRLPNVFATEGLTPDRWRDLLELPTLREHVEALLTPAHRPSRAMALLINPTVEPWLMTWHRDWLHNAEAVDTGEWLDAARNTTMFNQLNAPLYDDASLWIRPGSHNRPSRPDEEAARAAAGGGGGEVHGRPLAALSEICRAMPGGEPVRLSAGDIALYRNSSWHAGLYDHRDRRATLHTWFDGDDDRGWQQRRRSAGKDAKNYASPALN
ncbi:hypothetical protein [Actinoplanes sp. NPDC026619]|uniref:hypothetical protein n=1 Tax=Actinoplanes sp. NPDC026619 TaxID=3155798 RepID=UPI0033D0262B